MRQWITVVGQSASVVALLALRWNQFHAACKPCLLVRFSCSGTPTILIAQVQMTDAKQCAQIGSFYLTQMPQKLEADGSHIARIILQEPLLPRRADGRQELANALRPSDVD